LIRYIDERSSPGRRVREKKSSKHHIDMSNPNPIRLSDLFDIEEAQISKILISYENNCTTPCGVQLKIDHHDKSFEYLIPNKSLMDPKISNNSRFFAKQQKIMIDDHFCEWVLPPMAQWDKYVKCESPEYVWVWGGFGPSDTNSPL